MRSRPRSPTREGRWASSVANWLVGVDGYYPLSILDMLTLAPTGAGGSAARYCFETASYRQADPQGPQWLSRTGLDQSTRSR